MAVAKLLATEDLEMENDTQVVDLSWNRTQELDEEQENKENNPVGKKLDILDPK